MSLNVGDIVTGRVFRHGPRGVYFRTPEGHRGFVDFAELSWERGWDDARVPAHGAEITALVGRVHRLAPGGPFVFAATVKGMTPLDNPWHEQNLPAVGDELEGVVVAIGESMVVELPTGIDATVYPIPGDVEMGQSVRVVVRVVNAFVSLVRADLIA